MRLKLNRQKGRGLAVYALTILLSMAFLYFGNLYATNGMPVFAGASMEKPVRAKVSAITGRSGDSYTLDGTTSVENLYINFDAYILSGWQKGQTVPARQTLDGFTPVQNKEVEPGDKILIFSSDPSSAYSTWLFWEYDRMGIMGAFLAIFALLVLLFGHVKGFNTLVSLTFTCLAIFAVFLPSILTGRNIYISSISVCLFVIVMTLLLVNGPNAKGVAAGVGCLGGTLVSGGLTLVMDLFLKLTGLVDEDSAFLLYMDTPKPIDLKGIIFAAIIIGALGAIMDVAMSIASSLHEVASIMEAPTFGALMHSGMQIGRDIIGTMANTLVLAYIGSSLSVVLLMIAYNSSLLGMLNKEAIVTEVLQALVGSLGILFTIPLTSAVSALVYTRGRRAALDKGTGPA